MSMSIVVWAACSMSLPGDLPESESWKNYGQADWAYEAESWQVILEPASTLTVPDQVKLVDPQIYVAIYMTVEPTKAPLAAYKFLNSVAASVATKCGGAVLQTPSGLVHLDTDGQEKVAN